MNPGRKIKKVAQIFAPVKPARYCAGRMVICVDESGLWFDFEFVFAMRRGMYYAYDSRAVADCIKSVWVG